MLFRWNPSARLTIDTDGTVVIGAGTAGLAAARALADAGREVVVVEARGRIGGRIHTQPLAGAALDLGASWIHGHRRNPVARLVRELGLQTVASDLGSFSILAPGAAALPPDQVRDVRRAYRALERRLRARRDALSRDCAIGEVIEEEIEALALLPEAARAVRSLAFSEIELSLGAPLDLLSLREWDIDKAYRGDDWLLPGGMAELATGLARGLDVRLGFEVHRISQDAEGVTIRSTADLRLAAARAIVTLPLGVLQQRGELVEPALAADKTAALGRLSSGVLAKVALAFDRPFWPAALEGFVLDPGDGRLELWSHTRTHGAPILMAFAAGDLGTSLEATATRDAAERVLKALRNAFGTSLPEPTDFLSSRWSRDLLARGAYTCLPVGASLEDCRILGRPEGRLHFAGEATSPYYPGTLHGALLSGRRAADEVLAAS